METEIKGIKECMMESTQEILQKAVKNGRWAMGTLVTVVFAVAAFLFTQFFLHLSQPTISTTQLRQLIDKVVEERAVPLTPHP